MSKKIEPTSPITMDLEEVLPENETITFRNYKEKLKRLSGAQREKLAIEAAKARGKQLTSLKPIATQRSSFYEHWTGSENLSDTGKKAGNQRGRKNPSTSKDGESKSKKQKITCLELSTPSLARDARSRDESA